MELKYKRRKAIYDAIAGTVLGMSDGTKAFPLVQEHMRNLFHALFTDAEQVSYLQEAEEELEELEQPKIHIV